MTVPTIQYYPNNDLKSEEFFSNDPEKGLGNSYLKMQLSLQKYRKKTFSRVLNFELQGLVHFLKDILQNLLFS